MKIWMTDGSGAPFADVAVLPVSHPGTLGGEIPYKGALGLQTYASTLDDLRGHNLLGLAREVYGIIVEPGTPVDVVVIAETGTVGRGQLTPRPATLREL